MELVTSWILAGGLLVLFFVVFFRMIRIVPEQETWVVEFFGKFQRALGPGFHLVVPLLQRVSYKQILKEEVFDVPPQVCITRDNVQVTVDGVLYLKVIDPVKASYGIDNYRYAAVQLAQTTMRSEIGKIDLDNTFSERRRINEAIVQAVDEASDPWGVKVTRYEIRDISPTQTVAEALEQQVRAEREKRAEILASEGERESRINVSEGNREEAVNLSQGERQRRINESDGRAEAMKILATATAEGIKEVASSINSPNGDKAVKLRIAEQFIDQLRQVLSNADTTVMPHDMAQLQGIVSQLFNRGGQK